MSLSLTFSNFASYLDVRRGITLPRDPALHVRSARTKYRLEAYATLDRLLAGASRGQDYAKASWQMRARAANAKP